MKREWSDRAKGIRVSVETRTTEENIIVKYSVRSVSRVHWSDRGIDLSSIDFERKPDYRSALGTTWVEVLPHTDNPDTQDILAAIDELRQAAEPLVDRVVGGTFLIDSAKEAIWDLPDNLKVHSSGWRATKD